MTIQLINEISPFVQEDHKLGIPLHLRVLASLSFYASGCYQRRVGMDAFCMMSQSKISKCIKEISSIIAKHLAPTYIQFPQTQADVDLIKLRFKQDYGVDGVIGLVDGVQVAVAGVPLDLKKAFLNHKKFASVNTQGTIDSDMRFLNVNARYPGSTQDAFIWNNSLIFSLLERNFNLENQENNIYRDCFLIGDLGYPLQPWLMVPVKKFTKNRSREKKYNKTIRKVRNKNERGFAVLKNRFRCILGERKLRYNHENVANIIYSCVTLHNFLISNSFDIEHMITVRTEEEEEECEIGENETDFRMQNSYLEQGKIVRNRLIAANV